MQVGDPEGQTCNWFGGQVVEVSSVEFGDGHELVRHKSQNGITFVEGLEGAAEAAAIALEVAVRGREPGGAAAAIASEVVGVRC